MKHSESFAKVAAALVKVQSLAGSAGKSGDNKFDKYRYAKLEDYLRATEGLLKKNNLLLVTTVNDWTLLQERKTQKGGVTQWVKVDITLTVVHESGEWISIDSKGEGQDRSDKSTYKAVTGARKYGMAMIFNMATTDDPEKAAPKEDKEEKQKAEKKEHKEQPKKEEQAERLPLINWDDKREKITAAVRVATGETEQLEKVRRIPPGDRKALKTIGEEVLSCPETGEEQTREACLACEKFIECKVCD